MNNFNKHRYYQKRNFNVNAINGLHVLEMVTLQFDIIRIIKIMNTENLVMFANSPVGRTWAGTPDQLICRNWSKSKLGALSIARNFPSLASVEVAGSNVLVCIGPSPSDELLRVGGDSLFAEGSCDGSRDELPSIAKLAAGSSSSSRIGDAGKLASGASDCGVKRLKGFPVLTSPGVDRAAPLTTRDAAAVLLLNGVQWWPSWQEVGGK